MGSLDCCDEHRGKGEGCTSIPPMRSDDRSLISGVHLTNQGLPMSRESKTEEPENFSNGSDTGSNDLHDRIQSKLNELHTDFRQLRADIRTANKSGERARKDRIEGFRRALRDLLKAADRADREWQ